MKFQPLEGRGCEIFSVPSSRSRNNDVNQETQASSRPSAEHKKCKFLGGNNHKTNTRAVNADEDADFPEHAVGKEAVSDAADCLGEQLNLATRGKKGCFLNRHRFGSAPFGFNMHTKLVQPKIILKSP